MAVSGFKGFGWLLGIATVSPACYMVSSQVAAERGRVEAVERAVSEARQDIRTLETEFDTRANLAQLERWNGDVLALSAPRPDQYLPSDRALASLQPLPNGQRYAAASVMPAATDVAQAVVAPIVQPAVAITMPPKPLESPPAIETARAAVHRAVATTVKGRIQTVAMVDAKLLSDATFGDLVSSARSERGSLR